jgi:hypothetical protein
MLVIHGSYRLARKQVAYRNDWCNHCNKPVLAQQWRSFYVGHLYWIPVLPLGFHKTWLCPMCDNNPRERVRTSSAIIVAGLVVFLLVFIIALFGPNVGEEAPIVWGMRFGSAGLALVFAAWLRFRLKASPPQRNVEPLRNDRCLICGGRMTDYPQWHCVECGLIRYDN